MTAAHDQVVDPVTPTTSSHTAFHNAMQTAYERFVKDSDMDRLVRTLHSELDKCAATREPRK